MEKTFGFPQSDWDLAKQHAHSAMVAAARSATGMITYSDLVDKIIAISFKPDAHIFHELLGQISRTEDEEARDAKRRCCSQVWREAWAAGRRFL